MGKFTIKATLGALSIAFFLEALVLFVATGATLWAMTSSESKALLTDTQH